MNVSLRAQSDKKKERKGGLLAPSSEPGRQALAPGMFINLKIFRMLLQCCFFWFSGQGECIEGTGFRLVERLLDWGCALGSAGGEAPRCLGGGGVTGLG